MLVSREQGGDDDRRVPYVAATSPAQQEGARVILVIELEYDFPYERIQRINSDHPPRIWTSHRVSRAVAHSLYTGFLGLYFQGFP